VILKIPTSADSKIVEWGKKINQNKTKQTRNSTSLQKDENSFNMATDDLLRELIKGQKNMAEKFTKGLKDLAEDFVEKLTAQTKAIVTIGQDIKVIKDEINQYNFVHNLHRRVSV
jgi:hypothetical protein